MAIPFDPSRWLAENGEFVRHKNIAALKLSGMGMTSFTGLLIFMITSDLLVGVFSMRRPNSFGRRFGSEPSFGVFCQNEPDRDHD